MLVNLGKELDAAHGAVRHAEAQQHELGRPRGKGLQGGLKAVGLDDREASLTEARGHHGSYFVVVLDEKDFHRM